MLLAWMSNNNTKTWSEGLRFIQSKKNQALYSGIKTSPYEAMFGTAQRIGLENQTNDTSEETVDKKDNKKVYFAICEE